MIDGEEPGIVQSEGPENVVYGTPNDVLRLDRVGELFLTRESEIVIETGYDALTEARLGQADTRRVLRFKFEDYGMVSGIGQEKQGLEMVEIPISEVIAFLAPGIEGVFSEVDDDIQKTSENEILDAVVSELLPIWVSSE
tara:strand:+ start:373 stop:792 length:420 start_codon:yes stop_codon:yes gene_type:complete